jgi:hypothetical protein
MTTDFAGLTIAGRINEDDGAGPTGVFGELRRELMNAKNRHFGHGSPDLFCNSPGNAVVTAKGVAEGN